jgi:pSer/pThr/pTyr-binding forkhead associated (FHA) protein
VIAPTPLLIVHSKATAYAVPLTTNTSWTIGRSQSNTIVLYDRWASRQHARLEVRNQAEIYLVDLQSRNGTWLKGKRITEPICLEHETQFRIGEHQLEFRLGSASFQGTCPGGVSQRAVLLAAPTGWQEQVWRELLMSQGISVLTEQPDHTLKLLTEMNPALPELLLGIGDLGEIAAWVQDCRARFPKLPLLVVNTATAPTTQAERDWAKSLGILEILPSLPEDDFVAKAISFGHALKKVLHYLDWRPIQDHELDSVLLHLQAQVNNDDPSQSLEDFIR